MTSDTPIGIAKSQKRISRW